MENETPPTSCEILYRDAHLVIVNKPAGVLSHPNAGPAAKPSPCAFEGRYNPDTRCFTSNAGPLWLVHRLDQDTSGVLIAATSAKVAESMRTVFEGKHISKFYLALVAGQPTAEGRWVDHLVTKHDGPRLRTTVKHGAKPNALAHYRVKARDTAGRWSLLEIQLVSGKTHQIRVQGSSRHLPVAGDDVYGRFDWNKTLRRDYGLTRLFLHASSISFPHPVTNKSVTATAPLPSDLATVLERLQS